MSARYKNTNAGQNNERPRVSLIKNNATVKRVGAAVGNARKQKRVSPLWVEKIDQEKYMRRDRFTFNGRNRGEHSITAQIHS